MLEKSGISFYAQTFGGVMLIFVFVVTFGFAAPSVADHKGDAHGKGGGNASEDPVNTGDSLADWYIEACVDEDGDAQADVCNTYNGVVPGAWINGNSHTSFAVHVCEAMESFWSIFEEVDWSADVHKNWPKKLVHVECYTVDMRHKHTSKNHFDDLDNRLWSDYCELHEDEGGYGFHHDLDLGDPPHEHADYDNDPDSSCRPRPL